MKKQNTYYSITVTSSKTTSMLITQSTKHITQSLGKSSQFIVHSLPNTIILYSTGYPQCIAHLLLSHFSLLKPLGFKDLLLFSLSLSA